MGLVVSPDNAAAVPALSALLHNHAWEPLVLPWPPRLDLDLTAWLRACDWTVIDLDTMPGRLVAAFTHGQFVPSLPFVSPRGAADLDEETLYGEIPTGHRKAIVRWGDPDDLVAVVEPHLRVIDEQPRYIGNTAQAVEYFRSAAKRNERIFLSYASANGDIASTFSQLLGDRFQNVFDFRDHHAVGVGEDWLDRLVGNLARSAVGVLLLSRDYLGSEYCMLEARELYRRSVEGQVKLVPVCLERMALPEFLKGTRYRSLYRHQPEEIITGLLSQLAATA